MRLHHRNLAVASVALALAALCMSLSAGAAGAGAGQGSKASPTPRKDPEAQRVEDRAKKEKGINITEPRVMDDAQLQQALQELEARLALLKIIDQRLLTDRLGAVSGASQQISSFGLNVQGAPLPQVVTTSKGATGTTTDTQQVTGGTTGSLSTTITAAPTGTTTATNTQSGQTTGTTGTLQTVSGLATEDVVTTRAAFGPPAVTAPAPTVNMPSTFSTSSSDNLSEMMQLTAEINALRLMLAGDLSSHYIRGGEAVGNAMTKLKTTLGFNISVKPSDKYQDMVAVVEVEVENVCDTIANEPPAIVAILPREKTYNVAAITDKSTSVGGGVATHILGVSGSWLTGRKTHYLVQDQDTVALTFTPDSQPEDICASKDKTKGTWVKKRVGFMWQFRPVLGRRVVKEADKMALVRLAFAVKADAKDNQIGKVRVRSYWRRYDRKKGVTKEVVPYSVREHFVEPFDIPRYKLLVDLGVFNYRDSLEDLGGGHMLVKLLGNFLPGTNVRIGSTTLAVGDRFRHDYSGIRFVAPISDLATKKVFIVAHDGTELPLVFPESACSETAKLSITGAPRVTTVDETNSRVTVKVNHPEWAKVTPEDRLDTTPPIVFVVGQRVFGFSDAPLKRDGDELSFVAPTALLVGNPELTVQTLFPAEGCISSRQIEVLQPHSQAERMVALEKGDGFVKFLLLGSRLKNAKVISPAVADADFEPVVGGGDEDGDTLRMLKLTDAQLKTHKQIFLRRTDAQGKFERPIRIDIPAVESKKPDPPKAKERLTVGADEAVIEGEGLKEVDRVYFRKRVFSRDDVEVADDGKSLRLSGLTAFGVTSTAATRPIVLEYKSGTKVTVNLEVVSSKVETIPK